MSEINREVYESTMHFVDYLIRKCLPLRYFCLINVHKQFILYNTVKCVFFVDD